MPLAISRDGTAIAYERSGAGPPLILVDGAFCSRAFGPMPKLARQLAPHFTVIAYDRRGRGQSGDTPPYGPEREVEDLAALIDYVGELVDLVGLSSGGALALEAAASNLPIRQVIAYEPPFVGDTGRARGVEHEPRLNRLIAAGDRRGAVKYFMRSMVGLPAPVVMGMRLMPWIWRQLEAVAHTLPYDAAIMRGFSIPTSRLSEIRIPTVVMSGSKTDVTLQHAARGVAEAIQGARHVTLPGQTHNVNPAVLTPAIVEILAS